MSPPVSPPGCHPPFPGGFSSLSVPWPRFKPREMGLKSQLCSGLAQSRCLVTSAHLGSAGPGLAGFPVQLQEKIPCPVCWPCHGAGIFNFNSNPPPFGQRTAQAHLSSLAFISAGLQFIKPHKYLYPEHSLEHSKR